MPFDAGSVSATFNAKTTSFLSSMNLMAMGVQTVTMAFRFLTDQISDSVKVANEFQKGMGDVATLIDTAVISTVEMSKSLLLMDPQLGMTQDLVKGLYQEFSAVGGTASDALEEIEIKAKFAVGGLTTLTKSTDVLTTITNAYGKEVISTTTASDILFRVIEKGKINADQLASQLGKVVPTAAQMGVGLVEVGSALVAMTKQGASAAKATTQLDSLMQAFLRPSTAMKEVLTDLGYESGQAFLQAEGLSGAMSLLTKEVDKDANSLSKLLTNKRGVQGFFSLSGEGAGFFSDALVALNDSQGATDIAFAKQEKTFATFQATVGKVKTVIGNVAKTLVDEAARGLSLAGEGFVKFALSAKGGAIVGDIIGNVTGVFKTFGTVVELVKKNVIEPLIETWVILQDELDNTGIKGEEGINTFDLLGQALQFAFSFVKVFTNGLQSLQKATGAFILWGDALVNVWDRFWEAALFQKRDPRALQEALEVLSEANDAVVASFEDIIPSLFETTVDEITSFSEKAKYNSVKLETTFKESSDRVKDHYNDNWEAIVTGQINAQGESLDLFGTYTDEVNEFVDGLGADTEEAVTASLTSTTEAIKKTVIDIGGMTGVVAGGLSNISIAGVNAVVTVENAVGGMTGVVAGSLSNIAIAGVSAIDYAVGGMTGVVAGGLSNIAIAGVSAIDYAVGGMTSIVESGGINIELAGVKAKGVMETFKDNWQDATTEMLDNTTNFFRSINNLSDLSFRTRANQLDYSLYNEKDKLDTKLASALISEEEYNTALTELNTNHLEKEDKLKEKQFNADKRMSLVQVAIDTASGVMSAVARLGGRPIALAAMVTANVAIGAIQAGLIAKQKYVPSFQFGGETEGGPAFINERGPEMVVLPGGSLVLPYELSKQIADNTGQGSYVFNNNFTVGSVSSEKDIDKIVDRVQQVITKELRLRSK